MRGKTFADVGASRANHFDILRLLLAILVIFHHSYAVLYKGRVLDASTTEPLTLLTRGRADMGSAAVYGFFIISGFLITASWIREPRVGTYLKKRVLRIYPAFIAMMAFCLLVVAPLGALDPAVYWHGLGLRDVLSSLVRLQMPATPGVFVDTPAHSVNVSVWTIAYEFRCYLLVVLLGLLGAFRWRGAVLFLFAAMLGCFFWVTRGGGPVLHGASIRLIGDLEFWPPLMTYFIAGAVFYLYRERIPYSPAWFAAACVGVVACLVLNVVAALPVFGTYCLLYVAFYQRWSTAWLGKHGDFSYGIYLYAFPIQQLMQRHFPHAWTPTRLSLAALALTTLMAALSWHLVEKRFLRRRRTPPSLATRAPEALGDGRDAPQPPPDVAAEQGAVVRTGNI